MISVTKHTRGVRRCFMMCWIGYALAYMCRMNYSMAMPFISADLPHLAERTGVIGSFFFFSYACGQLVCGYLGDRTRPERMIFLGLLFSALANAAFGFARSFFGMAGAWLLNGCFQSMLWGPIIRIVSRIYSAEEYNRVTPVLMLSTVTGYLAAWLLSGVLSSLWSWRFAMWVPAALLFAYAVYWFFGIGDVGALRADASRPADDAHGQPQRIGMLDMLTKAKLWPVLGASFCQGMVKDGISLWAPMYFLTLFGMSFSDTIGFILLIPVFNALGVCFASWLNRRMRYRERRTSALLFCLTLALLAAVVRAGGASILAAALLVAAASGMSHGTNSILLSFLPLKCSVYGRSSTVAGLMDFCSYLGVAVSSVGVGALVARGHVALIPAAWLLAAACGTGCMLLSQEKPGNR